EDQDIELIVGIFQPPKDTSDGDGLIGHILLPPNPGIHRNQIILPTDLDAMPRKIEQAYTALPELATEQVNGLDHGAARRIAQQGDVEPELAEGRGHIAGIMHRIAQHAYLIGRIANHQRCAALGSGCSRKEQKQESKNRELVERVVWSHGILHITNTIDVSDTKTNSACVERTSRAEELAKKLTDFSGLYPLLAESFVVDRAV